MSYDWYLEQNAKKSAPMNSKLRDIFAEYYHRWVKYGYYGNPEKLDQDTEFNQFEKAIRQAVGEEILELIDAEIEASKKNLAYAEENNHSDRTRANWKGCIEGEMFCRQKIKKWQEETTK